MSELEVKAESLNQAAINTNKAADCGDHLKVSGTLGSVGAAMKGGGSGDAANNAARSIDDASRKMTAGLRAFSKALTDSDKSYKQQDVSTKVSFENFNNAIEGKN